MALAAFYAGLAFTKAYVGYVHAFSHKIGGMYGVPHGLANAITLPYVLDFLMDAPLARRRLAELAVAIGAGTAADPATAGAALRRSRARAQSHGRHSGNDLVTHAGDVPAHRTRRNDRGGSGLPGAQEHDTRRGGSDTPPAATQRLLSRHRCRAASARPLAL